MGTYNFLDTDEIIERATGMSIPEIFESEGEEGFRTAESQVLDSVHPYVRCVISTGGGIVTRNENWSKLQTGIVVWLDCEPEVIMKRIEGTDRPLLQTDDPLQKLKDLLDERRDKYNQADVRVEVEEDMDEHAVTDTVIRILHDFIDGRQHVHIMYAREWFRYPLTIESFSSLFSWIVLKTQITLQPGNWPKPRLKLKVLIGCSRKQS